jgi:sugar phosphate isomerase/epimerase
MQLGFVSAILPDLSLKEVLKFAGATGFDCVELMCWPTGKAERRYAGVTHIDVDGLDDARAEAIQSVVASSGVSISSMGYYPNALTPDRQQGELAVAHIRKVILAAAKLGVPMVTTFIGRDWTRSVEENWPRFEEVWIPLIGFAEQHGIKIAIENCPMLFTADEWPGGKNLAVSPAIWRRMFEAIPSSNFGLNYDPSHLVWQGMDYIRPLREFKTRIFSVHIKDVRMDRSRLNDVGILAHPLEFHSPKLPGLGDIDWAGFFSELRAVGYAGPANLEVEDRAFEGSREHRELALAQSYTYLRRFVPRQRPKI